MSILSDESWWMEYRYIVFDFDGVLAETNEIRFQGFSDLFAELPPEAMVCFMDFVKANGGLSRYGKIRHLYNHILRQPASESQVDALAQQYSKLVAERVTEAPAVSGSLEFLAEYADRFEYAVVSGSDQSELRQVCRARGIDGYFRTILGSPIEKTENIVELLSARAWDRQACLYVGDSTNDYDAAAEAGIGFIGRNSGLVDWKDRDAVWVSGLAELPAAIEELARRRDEGTGPESKRSIT